MASVSSGLTPSLTWVPDCTVGYLSVLDAHGQPTWIIVDSGSAIPPLNGIQSGVIYGTVPAEAKMFGFGTTPLVAGEPYYLLLRVSDDQGGPGRLVDTLSFTP